MSQRRIPRSLEEAYLMRDSADNLEDRDFYQDHVYRLRRAEYQRRGIPTDSSSKRRERRSAVEFSREVFFLEATEIAAWQGLEGGESAREEARCHAARIDEYASSKQLDAPQTEAVEPYRRNYLELLRAGMPADEAYYLSRVIGPVGDAEFRSALENVRRTGYPSGRLAYTLERAAIQLRDLPGGMVLILLTFFASAFALYWTLNALWGAADAGTTFSIGVSLLAAGCLMLTLAVIVAVVRSVGK